MAKNDYLEKKVNWCPSCHQINLKESTQCPYCKAATVTEQPSQDELTIYSRVAHNNATNGYQKLQNALCFVVIGAILAAIGGLFIFLSLDKINDTILGIRFDKPQIYVAIIFLSIGGASLLFGCCKVVFALIKRSKAKNDIAYISMLRKANHIAEKNK